jgi:hypothetical protein
VYSDIDGGDAWGRRKQVEMVVADYEKEKVDFSSLVDALDGLMGRAAGNGVSDEALASEHELEREI